MRRRLGVAVHFEGDDRHGHLCLANNTGANLNARHDAMIAAWRQVFFEAGGAVPDRNIERLLRRSHIPVPPGDMRRLDIVVTRLNVHRGLPLFCDVTIVSPLSGDGEPRGGTSNHDGTLLRESSTKTTPRITKWYRAVWAACCVWARKFLAAGRNSALSWCPVLQERKLGVCIPVSGVATLFLCSTAGGDFLECPCNALWLISCSMPTLVRT